jgi:Dual specificity phosphatase, catalytic domain
MSEKRWRLDLDWVTPLLAVGGRFPIEAAGHLAQRLGIRYIVDLRGEACDDEPLLRAQGIGLLRLPTVGLRAISLPMMEEGVAWVTKHLERGYKVYIHCEHGVGRSATLALAVMVAQGYPPLEALALAKKARWQLSPSPEQLSVLRAWAEGWRARHGAAWTVPTFDELAAIAHGHLNKG